MCRDLILSEVWGGGEENLTYLLFLHHPILLLFLLPAFFLLLHIRGRSHFLSLRGSTEALVISMHLPHQKLFSRNKKSLYIARTTIINLWLNAIPCLSARTIEIITCSHGLLTLTLSFKSVSIYMKPKILLWSVTALYHCKLSLLTGHQLRKVEHSEYKK